MENDWIPDLGFCEGYVGMVELSTGPTYCSSYILML